MSETIIFFGSGPVAAKSLELLSKSFDVEVVVTKAKPEHHHDVAPVEAVAKNLSLPIVEASDKKDLSEKLAKHNFASRIAVLIDFGIIVSQDVIDTFPLGIVNSHFSLLPEWRGPDPITFAILSGQAKTGVSLMLLVEKMDEGPILAQAVYDIKSSETSNSLTEGLIELSDALLKNLLPDYINGAVAPQPQSVIMATEIGPRSVSYSRKIVKSDGLIDWRKPAIVIEREIRAFIDWPKSHTVLADHEVIITKSQVIDVTGIPGEVKIQAKKLVVFTGEQALEILRLKPSGKAEMAAEAFLAGYGRSFKAIKIS